jgi:hypothetical protein
MARAKGSGGISPPKPARVGVGVQSLELSCSHTRQCCEIVGCPPRSGGGFGFRLTSLPVGSLSDTFNVAVVASGVLALRIATLLVGGGRILLAALALSKELVSWASIVLRVRVF